MIALVDLAFVKRSRERKGFIIFVFGFSAGNICCRCLLNHGGSRREGQGCRPKGLQFETKNGKANKADLEATIQKESANIDAHTAEIED